MVDRVEARLVALLASPRFLPILVLVFFVACTVFALVVYIPADLGTHDGIRELSTFTRAPDESRHIGNIFYYADRPLLAGPVIAGAPDKSIWLGEVERFPSYLYYYLMSFPARVFESMGLGYTTTVVLLRMITALSGALGLVVLSRILAGIGFSLPVANAATLAMALTGAYLWQSAAVSYDIPSQLLFMLFVLAAVRLINERKPGQLLLMLLWALLVSITKYTYLPFAVAGAAGVIVFVLLRDRRPAERRLWAAALRELLARRARLIGIGLALAVALALFAERIVGNYLSFGDADPDCDAVRPHELCLKYDIFRRNDLNTISVQERLASGELVREPFAPLAYTGTWLQLYYRSTYFYRGLPGGPLGAQQLVFVAAALLLLLVAVAFVLNRERIVRGPAAVFVVSVALVYLVGVYFFNLRTFLERFEYYAHSGRYMLLSLGLIYPFAIVVLVRLWRRAVKRSALLLALPMLLFVLAVVVLHSPPVTFMGSATSPEWYSTFALDHLPVWLTGRPD